MWLTYLLVAQVILVGTSGLVVILIDALPVLTAVMYGGSITMMSTLLLAWGLRRASFAAVSAPRRSGLILVAASFQRFMLIAVLFGFGIEILEMEPLAVLIGFAITQLSFGLTLWLHPK